ncbi:hypothetical protein BC834DRAFT_905234 [Gloeopeniophorella convolvens]|nr:hypothetical protein BC834DRAFT_905234 [Gloeopeniophorella convolvens]
MAGISSPREVLPGSSESYWDECLQLRLAQRNLLDGSSTRIYDEEMAAINTMMRSLAARRNATLIAPVLERDVLVLIFEACRDDSVAVQQASAVVDDPVDSTQLGQVALTPRRRIGWIACSQVCRHWRDVALETPSLWKELYLGLGPLWLKVSLDRAQSTPGIHLFGFMGRQRHTKHDGPILHRDMKYSHLSALSVNIQNHNLHKTFLFHLLRDKPSLERIVLKVGPKITGELVMAVTVLVHHSPMIRRISLGNTLMGWNPLPFTAHRLTRLDITIQGSHVFKDVSDPTLSIDIRSAVRFLKDAPALEVLKLYNAFPPLRVIPDADETIELPHLQELELVTDSYNCLYFVSHVTFQACKTQLDLVGDPIDALQIAALIQISFRLFYESNDADGAGVLHWIFGSARKMQILAHPTLYPVSGSDTGLSTLIKTDASLSFDLDSGVQLGAIVRAACDALPPSFVRTLVVEGRYANDLWQTYGECFPHVTRITTSNFGLFSLPHEPARFPRLESLDLLNLSLVLDGDHQRILRFIQRRQSSGRPIRRLGLHSTFADTVDSWPWVGVARELVEDVTVEDVIQTLTQLFTRRR